MTRSGLLAFCATLSAGLLACGGGGSTTPKNPLDLVPLDNEVSGWTVDQAHSKAPNARAMTGATEKQVEDLIDGGAEDFFQEPNIPTLFLWQNYLNSTLAAAPDGAMVKLYILELPSADQAKGLYTQILTRPNYQRKTGMPDDWAPTTPTVGEESRIQDTGAQWWVNFHKAVFYVEVLMEPSVGPPPDYATGNADTKQEAMRFAQAIASRI